MTRLQKECSPATDRRSAILERQTVSTTVGSNKRNIGVSKSFRRGLGFLLRFLRPLPLRKLAARLQNPANAAHERVALLGYQHVAASLGQSAQLSKTGKPAKPAPHVGFSTRFQRSGVFGPVRRASVRKPNSELIKADPAQRPNVVETTVLPLNWDTMGYPFCKTPTY